MKRLIFIFLFLSPVYLWSQDNVISRVTSNVIPDLPEAYSFAKEASVNVGLSTGTVTPSINLYTITSRSLSLPITLSYVDGNGVKVRELASDVGLGWKLTAGGAISRSVRGLPDDFSDIGFYILNNVILSKDAQELYNYRYDLEPDKFSYSFGGYSGTFYMNYRDDFFILQKPENNLRIEPIFNFNNNCSLESFRVTDDRGIIYEFSISEKEAAMNLYYQQVFIAQDEPIPMMWYLTKIIDPNREDTIYLEYQEYSYHYKELVSYLTGSNTSYREEDRYVVAAQRIKKITFAGGSVVFNYNDKRYDKQGGYLESMYVYDNTGNTVKRIDFYYSYFTPYGSASLDDFTEVQTDIRLRLDSLKINDMPPYVFSYYDMVSLPDRYSKSVDHWGYYNGKDNEGFLQEYSIFYKTILGDPMIIIGGDAVDRNPDPDYAKAGILTSIKYPTGGVTRFVYEGNRSEDAPNCFYREIGKYNSTGFKTNQEAELILPETYPLIVYDVRARILPNDPDFEKNEYTVAFESLDSGYAVTSGILQETPTGYTMEAKLAPGHYKVSVYKTKDVVPVEPQDVQITWPEYVTPYAGGVRVKQVIDSTSTRVIKKEYEYSNGHLVAIPFYGYIHKGVFYPRLDPGIMYSGVSVVYGNVTEKYSGDEYGYTEYYYTTSEEYPDLGGALPKWTKGINALTLEYYEYDSRNSVYILKNPFAQPDVFGDYRGKVYDKKQIKENKNKDPFLFITKTEKEILAEEKKEYFMESFLIQNDRTITGLYITKENITLRYLNGNIRTYYIYVRHYYTLHSTFVLPLREVRYEYDDSLENKEETTYRYNFGDSNFIYKPVGITRVHSDGSRDSTVILYPQNSLGNDEVSDLPLEEMARRNMYVPVMKKSYRNGRLLAAERVDYSQYGDRILPASYSVLRRDGKLYKDMLIDRYDLKGNPVEFHKRGDIKKVVLWGYNYSLPVIVVDGADYSEVELALPCSYAELQTKSGSEITDLYTILKQRLKGAKVSIYTYKNLIGVDKVKDPYGIERNFIYDSNGFLQAETDSDGLIKQLYFYKFYNSKN